MNEEVNLCPICGEDQRVDNINLQKSNETFLVVLCVLTIVGSLFTIGRAYLYELISMMDENSNYIWGWIYAATSFGTLVGAVMMIQRKLNGLYIYSVFQVIYLITVLIASFSHGDTFDDLGRGEAFLLTSGIAMLFLLPSTLFLILYWTKVIKRHLR